MMVKFVKTYIDVIVKMRSDGTMIPLTIMWDKIKYDIDNIIKIIPEKPKRVKQTSDAIKYICQIGDNTRDLFLEDNPRRWFIEKPIIQFT